LQQIALASVAEGGYSFVAHPVPKWEGALAPALQFRGDAHADRRHEYAQRIRTLLAPRVRLRSTAERAQQQTAIHPVRPRSLHVQDVVQAAALADRYRDVDVGNADLPGEHAGRVVVHEGMLDAEVHAVVPKAMKFGYSGPS
jgi:hypothetical protein